LLFAGGLLGWHAAALGADSAPTETRGEYSWSAKLVELDAADRTMTVEARIEQPEAIEARSALAEGDRVTLAWVGRTWAAGVDDIGRDLDLGPERLTLPVEFVSFEMEGHYVRFRVPVPDDARQALTALTPGDWVTATAARQSTRWEEAVRSVRPYNDV
jgi:hypothetical protein